MISPILKAFPGSTWRTDVETMWRFLQLRYNIFGSEHCATHVHVSIEPRATLQDLKRIAQAIIHFETAIEALVPPDRRGNRYAKSNWLDGPEFGRKGKSRRESIAAIEHVCGPGLLVDLMQPLQRATDRDYAWNFHSLFDKKTIEFRQPPVSVTPAEALSWAELAMSFVHAAVRCEPSELQKVPSTIGGLRWFLRQFHVPGMHEPVWLQRLWHGKDERAAVEPIPQPQGSSPETRDLEARLQRLAAADRRQVLAFAEAAREPYW